MPPSFERLLPVIRAGALDAELAALIWILAEGGLPVHVAASDPEDARAIVSGLEDLVRPVTVLPADSLEAALAITASDPALLGAVLVVADGRVTAAHWVRPALRDGAGHLREQGPAVLAVWDVRASRYEHFAWGVTPELAAVVGRKAGDFEAEHRERTGALAALALGPH